MTGPAPALPLTLSLVIPVGLNVGEAFMHIPEYRGAQMAEYAAHR